MRDVADLAGTSTAVVSYVFNEGPRPVAPKTREKVLAAANQLGYRPHVVARALRTGSTSSIGLVVPDICNPYFGELARAVERAALQHGKMLLIVDSELNPGTEQAHLRALVERRVDSIVLVSTAAQPDLAIATRASIPVVALHPIPAETGASSLTIDYEGASKLVTSHLIEHGYRELCLLNGPSAAGADAHQRGFETAIAAAPGVTGTIWRSEISRHAAAQVAAEHFSTGDRPRAVYCSTDEQAAGLLFAAYAAGLRVPEDLAVAGFDGTANTAVSIPPLTTVRQPLEEFATRALEVLASEEHSPVTEVLGYEFIKRRSCGCD